MIIPSEIQCDFCANTIARGTHFASLEVPIPPSVRSEMVEYLEKTVLPKRESHSPLSMMLGGAEQLVPSSWKLEVCIDCAYGIVPGLRETVISQIRDSIARGLEAKRRSAESLDSLEPEPRGGPR